jgi:hypothetical protein
MIASSTKDIVKALNIIASQLNSPDGIPETALAEAAIRLMDLVRLTGKLSNHILANPVHHPDCNVHSKGTYCSCILSQISSLPPPE